MASEQNALASEAFEGVFPLAQQLLQLAHFVQVLALVEAEVGVLIVKPVHELHHLGLLPLLSRVQFAGQQVGPGTMLCRDLRSLLVAAHRGVCRVRSKTCEK